jgi:hypothetical protein
MTSGMMLIPQPICRYKVCNGSLPPGFSTFRTCLNSGFGAVLQPLHVEETFQSSNRQSTNANAVFDLVHGATVNLACTDYGILKLDTNPLDWEGQMGLLNVASPLLGFEEGNACPGWSAVSTCCPSRRLCLGGHMDLNASLNGSAIEDPSF